MQDETGSERSRVETVTMDTVKKNESERCIQKDSEGTRIRLDFLDGLRGIAALLVFFLHARLEATWIMSYPWVRTVSDLTSWMDFGRCAVALFIVLSGFCLMLPVIRSEQHLVPGGTTGYLKRRATRILPPYYAALILSLSIMAVIPLSKLGGQGYWRSMWPAFQPGIILSHLALIHNWNVDWIFRINAPLWSVATEWQIYFAFPLFLLPVWKRTGIIGLLSTAFLIGVSPMIILYSFEWAAPWFVGSFAVGMTAAIICFSTNAQVMRFRKNTPWFWLMVTFAALLIGLCASPLVSTQHNSWKAIAILDIVTTLLTFCMLIHCTSRQATSSLARLLSSRPLCGLGAFSYSLYLMHIPVLGLIGMVTRQLRFSQPWHLLTLMCLSLPISLAICYLFYLCFERPFVKGARQPKLAEAQ